MVHRLVVLRLWSALDSYSSRGHMRSPGWIAAARWSESSSDRQWTGPRLIGWPAKEPMPVSGGSPRRRRLRTTTTAALPRNRPSSAGRPTCRGYSIPRRSSGYRTGRPLGRLLQPLGALLLAVAATPSWTSPTCESASLTIACVGGAEVAASVPDPPAADLAVGLERVHVLPIERLAGEQPDDGAVAGRRRRRVTSPGIEAAGMRSATTGSAGSAGLGGARSVTRRSSPRRSARAGAAASHLWAWGTARRWSTVRP